MEPEAEQPSLAVAPKVSVVVAAHGVESYIAACLLSLQQQTLRDLEVIVVDDCSPDGLADVVQEFAADDPRVRLIRLKENIGQGFARNRGLSEARGEYVFFLDADDVVASPRALERLTALADERGAEMVRGRKLHAHDPIDPAAPNPHDPNERWFSAKRPTGDIQTLPELWHNRHFWVFLYRRAFMEEHALRFETPQWEERPFLVGAYLKAKRIALSDVNAVLYRIRSDSTARRERTIEDYELLVRNVESVCGKLGPAEQPALDAAREFTVRQYVSYLLSSSRWHGLLSNQGDDVGQLLERYIVALDSLEVQPSSIRSDIEVQGPLSPADGDSMVLWALLQARELGLARLFAKDGRIPSKLLFSTLLDEGQTARASLYNDWLRTRRSPVPEPLQHQAAPSDSAPAVIRDRVLPKLVLHIGMSKTGSSYLQHCLDRSRPALARQGVWYPACGYMRQRRRPHKTAGHSLFGLAAEHDDPSLRDELLGEIDALDGRVHTLILSSEAFFLSGRAQKLRSYFQGFDCRVVVYLRRQDEWAHAQYCEFVAGGAVGRTDLSFEEWLARPETQGLLRYEQQLASWSEAFGRRNMVVRPYDPSQFVGGTLMSDFWEAAGLRHCDGLTLPSESERNVGRVTALRLSAMRLLNGLPFPDADSYLDFARDALAYLSRREEPRSEAVNLWTPQQRKQLLARVREGNAAVAKEFLGREEERIFPEKVSDSPPTSLPADLPIDILEELLLLYRRWRFTPRTPRQVAPRREGKRKLQRVNGGFILGDSKYALKLDSLVELRPRPFLEAIAMLADLQPVPRDTLEALAAEIRRGRLSKRAAAGRLLEGHPRAVFKMPLPKLDRLQLLSARLR